MEEFKSEKVEEKTTDIKLALFLISHIEKPCEDDKGNNVRGAYLIQAKEILKNREFENPYAKKMLEDIIKKYE